MPQCRICLKGLQATIVRSQKNISKIETQNNVKTFVITVQCRKFVSELGKLKLQITKFASFFNPGRRVS